MIGQSPGPRAWICRSSPRKMIRSIVAGNRFQPGGVVGPSETVSGPHRDRDRCSRAGLAGNHLADQAPQRRAHDDLALRLGHLALDLTLQQVGRAEHPGDEDVERPAVKLLRRAGLENPAQIHHGQAVGQRERLDAGRR